MQQQEASALVHEINCHQSPTTTFRLAVVDKKKNWKQKKEEEEKIKVVEDIETIKNCGEKDYLNHNHSDNSIRDIKGNFINITSLLKDKEIEKSSGTGTIKVDTFDLTHLDTDNNKDSSMDKIHQQGSGTKKGSVLEDKSNLNSFTPTDPMKHANEEILGLFSQFAQQHSSDPAQWKAMLSTFVSTFNNKIPVDGVVLQPTTIINNERGNDSPSDSCHNDTDSSEGHEERGTEGKGTPGNDIQTNTSTTSGSIVNKQTSSFLTPDSSISANCSRRSDLICPIGDCHQISASKGARYWHVLNNHDEDKILTCKNCKESFCDNYQTITHKCKRDPEECERPNSTPVIEDEKQIIDSRQSLGSVPIPNSDMFTIDGFDSCDEDKEEKDDDDESNLVNCTNGAAENFFKNLLLNVNTFSGNKLSPSNVNDDEEKKKNMELKNDPSTFDIQNRMFLQSMISHMPGNNHLLQCLPPQGPGNNFFGGRRIDGFPGLPNPIPTSTTIGGTTPVSNNNLNISDDDWEAMMEISNTDETEKIRQMVGDKALPVTDPNQCLLCRRVLSCKSALQMHYRTHTGERPFKCKICQRAFTTKGNLKTHMGVHRMKHSYRGLNEPSPLGMQHTCPICQKRFYAITQLQMHIAQHRDQLTNRNSGINNQPNGSVVNDNPFNNFNRKPPMMVLGSPTMGTINDNSIPPFPNFGIPPIGAGNGIPQFSMFPNLLSFPNPLAAMAAAASTAAVAAAAAAKNNQDVGSGNNNNNTNTSTPASSFISTDNQKEIINQAEKNAMGAKLLDILLQQQQTKEQLTREDEKIIENCKEEIIEPLEKKIKLDEGKEENDYNNIESGTSESVSPLSQDEITDNEGKGEENKNEYKSSIFSNLVRLSDNIEQECSNNDENPLDAIKKMYSQTEAPPPPRQPPTLSKHQCGVCYKHFSSSSALQIHMRTHTGDKPFKCDVCQRAFTTRGNLKVHMGTHSWQQSPSRRGRRIFDFPHDGASPTLGEIQGPRGNPLAGNLFLNPQIAAAAAMANLQLPPNLSSTVSMAGTPAFGAAMAMLAKNTFPNTNNSPEGNSANTRGTPINNNNKSSPQVMLNGIEAMLAYMKNTCTFCSKICSSPTDLEVHIRTHLQNGTPASNSKTPQKD